MNGVHRLLSRREKVSKTNGIPADRHDLFTLDEGYKKPTKDEDKKIKEVMYHLETLGAKNFTEEQCDYALRAKSVEGDTRKAFNLLMLLEDSVAGVLKNYDPSINMLGAVNRNNTTCYLDALLFAMFARLNSFEGILFPSFNDEPRKRLATVLRLWVNMLRTGRLVTTDITKQLQEALAKCGWDDAAKLKQQDVSEAFTFITDKLELPLLTLKMDIFHTGKEDASDDHKFVNERLLEVGIPEELVKDGKISLEDCLESYFNNRVEVKRHLSRLSTIQAQLPSEKSGALVEAVEVTSRQNSPARPVDDGSKISTPARPNTLRERATSIFTERKIEFDIDEKVDPENKASISVLRRRRKSSIRKEVLMPAWQFFSLIPWYTKNSPRTNEQIAAHFASKRPVLGICLKRYTVTAREGASRLDTHIDIPLDIALPHFVSDNLEEDAVFHRTFKLSLRSVICHRGVAVDAGHYIALVRTDLAEHAEWLRFDDLAGQRVKTVDIAQALKDESPYLLFYQVQPIEDNPPDEELPPYEEHGVSFDTLDQKLTNLSVNGRISVEEIELDRSARTSLDLSEGYRGRSAVSTPRRASIAWTDTGSVGGASSVKTDHGQMETNASHDTSTTSLQVTRNAPRIARHHDTSRATSTSSDKRLSTTLSRITSRLSGGGSGGRGSNSDPGMDEALEGLRQTSNPQTQADHGTAAPAYTSSSTISTALPAIPATPLPPVALHASQINPSLAPQPRSPHMAAPSQPQVMSPPTTLASTSAPGVSRSKSKSKGKESRSKLLRSRDKNPASSAASGSTDATEGLKSYSRLGAKPPERECIIM